MYRNHEGYSDPTAGAAMRNIMREERRRKKTVSSNRQNTRSTNTGLTRQKRRVRQFNHKANNRAWIKAITGTQPTIIKQEARHDLQKH